MYSNFPYTDHPLWERACSRKGHDIQHSCKLTHRFREQARSHNRLRAFTKNVFTAYPLRG
ncbi:hypothetical protein B0E42_20010 [Pseudomonas sp. A25(2017)]|nr:hypothetical protein B0E42_20010 [Pseudomonas sp. A25(2017)]